MWGLVALESHRLSIHYTAIDRDISSTGIYTSQNPKQIIRKIKDMATQIFPLLPPSLMSVTASTILYNRYTLVIISSFGTAGNRIAEQQGSVTGECAPCQANAFLCSLTMVKFNIFLKCSIQQSVQAGSMELRCYLLKFKLVSVLLWICAKFLLIYF